MSSDKMCEVLVCMVVTVSLIFTSMSRVVRCSKQTPMGLWQSVALAQAFNQVPYCALSSWPSVVPLKGHVYWLHVQVRCVELAPLNY